VPGVAVSGSVNENVCGSECVCGYDHECEQRVGAVLCAPLVLHSGWSLSHGLLEVLQDALWNLSGRCHLLFGAWSSPEPLAWLHATYTHSEPWPRDASSGSDLHPLNNCLCGTDWHICLGYWLVLTADCGGDGCGGYDDDGDDGRMKSY